jgi:hypothetical protein
MVVVRVQTNSIKEWFQKKIERELISRTHTEGGSKG